MIRTTSLLLPLGLLLMLMLAPVAPADEAGPLDRARQAAGTANGLCPVMGRPVTPQAGALEYRGERIGFCCPPCAAKFRADPARYMAPMREDPARFGYVSRWPASETLRRAKASARSANGLCPVMGRPVTADGGRIEHEGQVIAFCCPGCVDRFRADAEGTMRAMRADPTAYAYDRPGPSDAELRAAREAAGSVNGLCPIMKRPVRPNGGSVVHRGEKVAFCCPGCAARFRADADGHLGRMRGDPGRYGYVPPVR